METTSKKQDIPEVKILLSDLKKLLDDERPPINEKEDLGLDNDAMDYSINSSLSEEDVKKISSKNLRSLSANNSFHEDEVNDETNIEGIGELISDLHTDMPEFFPNQLSFDPVEELPGSQKQQIEHKSKTILKNKYWMKVLDSVYDMGTSTIPKAEHLKKILNLYIINQQKLKAKKDGLLHVKSSNDLHSKPTPKQKRFFAGPVIDLPNKSIYSINKLKKKEKTETFSNHPSVLH